MKKNPGCLGCIGDYTTQLYGDFLISQYKDPYKPTSIMESRRFFFIAHMKLPSPKTNIAPEDRPKHKTKALS